MRIGAYESILKKNSKIFNIYNKKKITERHRHRYEVNINYKVLLEENGVLLSGISPDGNLAEVMEIKNHPWFIGVQFHPELKSTPFNPHPIFNSFTQESLKLKKNDKR